MHVLTSSPLTELAVTALMAAVRWANSRLGTSCPAHARLPQLKKPAALGQRPCSRKSTAHAWSGVGAARRQAAAQSAHVVLHTPRGCAGMLRPLTASRTAWEFRSHAVTNLPVSIYARPDPMPMASELLQTGAEVAGTSLDIEGC